MRLFFFGTLLDPDLFHIAVGRPLATLPQVPAALTGYRRLKTRTESFPILVPHADGSVEGLAVGGMDPADLERLHFFEGEEYDMDALTVTLLADESGPEGGAAGDRVRADGFLSTGKLEDAGAPWSLAEWQVTEKPLALLEAEVFMEAYGVLSSAEADRQWPAMKVEARRRYDAKCRVAVPG